MNIMEIIRKEYSIPSKSGVADVFARCWVPADGAKAIFQIVHGMAEHGVCRLYSSVTAWAPSSPESIFAATAAMSA